MTADLDRLQDEREISSLIYCCCATYDAGRWEETAKLFEHGVWHVSDELALSGAEPIARFLEGAIRLYDGTPKTRHTVSNIRIAIAQDRASAEAESTVVVFQSPPGGPPRILIQGVYHDKFARHGDTWHFAERRATVDGAGDVSTHFHAVEPAGGQS